MNTQGQQTRGLELHHGANLVTLIPSMSLNGISAKGIWLSEGYRTAESRARQLIHGMPLVLGIDTGLAPDFTVRGTVDHVQPVSAAYFGEGIIPYGAITNVTALEGDIAGAMHQHLYGLLSMHLGSNFRAAQAMNQFSPNAFLEGRRGSMPLALRTGMDLAAPTASYSPQAMGLIHIIRKISPTDSYTF